MTGDLQTADQRTLHEYFVERLDRDGPEATFYWLADLLPRQTAGLRAQNCSYLAFTGRPEALSLLSSLIDSPVTDNWGRSAALLGAPWGQIANWLSRGGSHQLMALDALVAYRAPAANMSPLSQIAAPVLPEKPSEAQLEEALAAVVSPASSPRVKKTVQAIRRLAHEILGREHRGVAVADLPRLYLQPDAFSGAEQVLGRHEEAISGMRQSLQDLASKLP